MLLTATVATFAALGAPAQTVTPPKNPPVARPVSAPQERGWIGIALESREDVAGDPRVVVGSVAPGSPAETAGLAAGDVILAVGGATLGGIQDLSAALADSRPGQRLGIDVLRRFDVTLGSREGSQSGWLGVSIDDGRSIEMQGQTGTAVRLSSVNEGAPAGAAGLRAGDQLVAIDGRVARGSDALIDDIGSRSPGTRVSLDVSREIQVVLGRRDQAPEPTDAPDAHEGEDPPHERDAPDSEGHAHEHDAPDSEDHAHGHDDVAPRPAREPREPRPPREPRAPRESRAPRPPAPEAARGYLGIYLQDGDRAVIADAVERGPAEEAGFMAGDVVVSVDGNAVESSDQLIEKLRDTVPGQEIEVVVRRGEGTEKKIVKLGDGPVVFDTPDEAPSRGRFFGRVENGPLDAELRERMESMLGEWRASQKAFGERWSQLMEDARERGQGFSMPGPGLEALGELGQARWLQLAPPAALPADPGATQERDELRAEMRGLREELRGLREELAALRDALAE